MFKNYLKFTFRHLIKDKSYTAINIAGLSLSIVSVLVIFLILGFEYSFDTYHEDAKRIYRVVRRTDEFGKTTFTQGIPYPLPEALRLDFPEIEAVTIVDCNFEPPVISIKRGNGEISKYKEHTGVAHVNPDYFKIFTYKWLFGSPETALEEPNSVVISESLARKYFGRKNPLAKTISYDNHFDLQVTGVVQDVPPNTDLPFNMLVAFDADKRVDKNWGNIYGSVHCYLKLAKGVDPRQLESRFGDFHAKYREKKKADKVTLMLQPLSELHFDTRFKTFNRTIARQTLWALALIGGALILLACINFINLSTALVVHRAREVAIRKTLGSTRSRILWEVLGETGLITVIAMFVSLAILEVVVQQLETLLGYPLHDLFTSYTAISTALIVLFISITLGAGLLPALIVSRFTLTEALRRSPAVSSPGGGSAWRKGLIVLQFAISQALILSAIVISKQIKYLSSTDMGFSKEAIVEAPLPSNDESKLQYLKAQLLQNTGIRKVSFSNTGTASKDSWGGDYLFKDGEQIKEGHAQIKFVDADFLATYHLSLLTGRGFQQNDSTKCFLVNEAFAGETGYSRNARGLLNKYVDIWTREAPIVGVIKDFHTKSLHEQIEPVVLVAENIYTQVGIEVAMHDLQSELKTIEKVWGSVFPDDVLDYSFLDNTIAKFYKAEQRTAKLIDIFTIIAIAIGCMGLFGMISFMVVRRTKEIGIRKVLGASAASILDLLSRDLVRSILFANLLAWPVAWYAMNHWLENFAYRIDISWKLFAAAGSLALLIALLTVSTQALRAALANPVESLRCE